MPIYEYHCNRCGEGGEFLEKRDAPAVRKCPNCGRRTFKRQVSAAAFHLKGTGWYATDFRNKSKPPASPSDDGKPDSKPDSAKTDSESISKGASDSAVKGDSDSRGDSAVKPAKKPESPSSPQPNKNKPDGKN